MAAPADKRGHAARLSPAQEHTRALFDAINPGGRVFIHHVVYRDDGSFSMPTKMVLTDLSGIEDLECEVFRLACEHGWEPGEYVLRLREAGKNGVQRAARLWLEPPVKPRPS